MTNDMLFLFLGFTIVWLGIFGYLMYLRSQVRRLHDEFRNLRDTSGSPDTDYRSRDL